jgi:hypothetical protein
MKYISIWYILMLKYCAKTNTINKNTEALLYNGKEIGLEVNAEKYICMSCHQNSDKIIIY